MDIIAKNASISEVITSYDSCDAKPDLNPSTALESLLDDEMEKMDWSDDSGSNHSKKNHEIIFEKERIDEFKSTTNISNTDPLETSSTDESGDFSSLNDLHC
jgi:hypothetical protein